MFCQIKSSGFCFQVFCKHDDDEGSSRGFASYDGFFSNGYNYCTCSVDGTIVTSPDGGGITYPASHQQPPQTPTPVKTPPSHHHGSH
ncbi:hypothetical protein QYF36_007831 [Acer negundo]|nr:hypothetical protein QYF36_007831 [Acer negundo]